jgi:hypothetical protein
MSKSLRSKSVHVTVSSIFFGLSNLHNDVDDGDADAECGKFCVTMDP